MCKGTRCSVLSWENAFAHNEKTFDFVGMLVRTNEREIICDLRAVMQRLNPDLTESAHEQTVEKLTRVDFTRSLMQHKTTASK